jgi:predicted phosphohydrolase
LKLYAIGDLHLSFGVEKRMDVFDGWGDYEIKIEENWRNEIKEEDMVVLVGDISWGMSLEESLKDFEFVNSLPGEKLILKGNHDYWWSSAKKIKKFWKEHGLNTLELLHNNAFLFGDIAICGSRGWVLSAENENDLKLLRREVMRLEASILAGIKLNAKEIVVFLHYPPLSNNQHQELILDVLHKYKDIVKMCYYGHLHGKSIDLAFAGVHDGIGFELVSADGLNFVPRLVGVIHSAV